MSGTTDDPENRASEPIDPNDPPQAVPAGTPDGLDLTDPNQTEAAWREIVAELSDLSTNPDTDRTTSTPATTADFDFPVAPWVSPPAPRVVRAAASDPRAWSLSEEAQALEDAEDGYEPPDPGFSLSPDRMRNLGWFAVVVAPLAAVAVAVLWSTAPGGIYTALSALFLVGIGVLVWRLPTDHEDDPGSGGAVV